MLNTTDTSKLSGEDESIETVRYHGWVITFPSEVIDTYVITYIYRNTVLPKFMTETNQHSRLSFRYGKSAKIKVNAVYIKLFWKDV